MKSEIKIVQVAIGLLKPNEYNPKKITGEAAANLRESIRRFGMVDPIIANGAPRRRNVMIGGHQRLPILKELGFKTVPVVYVNVPDLKKEKELCLRLSQNTGEFSLDLLKEFETELLEDVGFDNKTLDSIAADPAEDPYKLDEEPEPEVKTRARVGEVYKLGPHRLLVGDSLNPENLKELLGASKADLVFTDPPYNLAYKSRGKLGKIENDNMSEEKFLEFCRQFIIDRLKENARTGAAVYICCDYASYPAFMYGLRGAGFTTAAPIIWVKDNLTMGWSDYRKKHEMVVKTKNPPQKKKAQPIVYAWNGGEHYFKESRAEADVWEVKKRASQTMVHPTQKPLELVRRAILNSSKRGGLVLDLFLGSGTTLIAAEQTGRVCYGAELDLKFADRIIARWEMLTKKTAEKIK